MTTEAVVPEEVVALAMAGTNATPVIDLPADGSCTLPGGLIADPLEPSRVVYDARVRELTGADEEDLIKARGVSWVRFLSTMLSRGVVEIGGEPATPELLRRLLVGDRDFLFMEIRRATYGSDLPYLGIECWKCQDSLDVQLTLDDIPLVKMKNPADREFSVPLRKGGHALVRLPVGSDQESALNNTKASVSEINTLMLAKTIVSLTSAAGNEVGVVGNADLVRGLGIADRQSILNELEKRQPGPQYGDVSITHEGCGAVIPLPIGPGDLFPSL